MEEKSFNLNDKYAEYRQKEDQWFKDNPNEHIYKMWESKAQTLVRECLESGVKFVSVNQTALISGHPLDYAVAIARLRENGIHTFPEELNWDNWKNHEL